MRRGMTIVFEGTDLSDIESQVVGFLRRLQNQNPSPSDQPQVQTRTEGEGSAGQQIATVAKDRIFLVELSAHPDVGPGQRGILRGDDGDDGYYLEFTGLFSNAANTDRKYETRTIWFEKKNVKEIYL